MGVKGFAYQAHHVININGDLQVPRSKTNFSDRAFSVAGPASWNRLPATIRSCDSLQSFKTQLKAHFF